MYPKDVSIGRHLASVIKQIMDDADGAHVAGTHQHTQMIFLRGIGAVTAAISELEMRMKKTELELKGESIGEGEDGPRIVVG